MTYLALIRIAAVVATCLAGTAIASPAQHVSASPQVVASEAITSVACVTNCFEKRWIYFYGVLGWGVKTANPDYNKLAALIVKAGELGYNGIVVNIGGEDSYYADLHDAPDFADNLASLQQLAAAHHVELIPMGGHPQIPAQLEPELSEAIAVEKTPFVVSQSRAVPAPRWLANDDFSNGSGSWQLMDTDTITFDPDTDRSKTGNEAGKGAIKLSQPNIMLDATTRKTQTRLHRRFVNLKPYTAYRVSFWLKTANYKAPLKVQIYDDAVQVPVYTNLYPMGRGTTDGAWNSAPNTVSPDQDWTNYNFDFNTGPLSTIRFYLGAWSNARNDEPGEAWIDDMGIREIGLAHTVTRAGLPIVVTSADGTVQYSGSNGQDYVAGVESLLIPSSSSIADGSTVLVSWYQDTSNMMPVWTPTASACPPRYMQLQAEGYERIKGLYPTSKKFFINYDEWRIMNWDPTCQYASAGAYLAGTMTAMQVMLKAANPGVQLYVWNDMFDPNMNAIDKYFMVNGSLAGAEAGIDPQTVVVNWTHNLPDDKTSTPPILRQQASLKFFHERHLKQVLALYYDDLALTDEWLDSLDAAEADGVTGVEGFMYTSWEDNGRYDDLEVVTSKIKARAKARWPQQE